MRWAMSLGGGHCALGYVAGRWPMPPCVGLCRWAVCVGLCRWAVPYATMRWAMSLGVCLASLGMALALGMSLCVYLARHDAKSL